MARGIARLDVQPAEGKRHAGLKGRRLVERLGFVDMDAHGTARLFDQAVQLHHMVDMRVGEINILQRQVARLISATSGAQSAPVSKAAASPVSVSQTR